MPTVEARFGGPTFKRAIKEADGRHPSRDPLILVDRRFEGVTIRVTGKTAAWYLRYKKVFHRLAPVGYDESLRVEERPKGLIYTADVAKELAANLREIVDRGLDPKAYLADWIENGSHESAATAAGRVAAKAAGAWKWGQLVDRFIRDWISQDKHLQDRVKPPSARTIKEVNDILRDPDLDHLKDKLVRDLTRADFEPVRDRWFEADRKARQKKLITYTKSALRWAKENFSESGLDDVPSWWRDMRHRAFSSKAAAAKARGEKLPRALTPADVAKLLFIAEKNQHVLGGGKRRRTNEITLAYLWWVCLVAQRTHASAAVRLSMIHDRVRTDGWCEVEWLPGDIKSKRPHSLPIPPEVYRRTIGRALAAPRRREGTIWAFPANRVIKPEKGDLDRPVGDYILNNLFARLRGVRSGEPDLLAEAGLPPFTPHSLRKAMATYLADQPLPPGTASAILDHAAKKTEGDAGAEAAVTSKHYNQSRRLPLKFNGLLAWSKAVLEVYEKLLVAERTRRFGPLSADGPGLQQLRRRLAPADLWLVDDHLPPAPGTTKPGPGRLDLGLVRETMKDEPDEWDEREVG